jgi:hypothetical protein
MNNCFIPVSLGELFDKYSILLIKKKRVNNNDKIMCIDKEIRFLQPYIDKFNLDSILKEEIKKINETLWDIEDKIRIKEKKNEFDDEFILLARSVYINNDQRHVIKNKINIFFNSEIKDIKSYV